MALCDAFELLNYFAEFPPVHEMVRAYLGYEGPVVKLADPEETVAQAVRHHAISSGVRSYESVPPEIRAVMEAHKEIN